MKPYPTAVDISAECDRLDLPPVDKDYVMKSHGFSDQQMFRAAMDRGETLETYISFWLAIRDGFRGGADTQ